MQPKFDLLFLFSAPQGHLLEVKRLDLGADAAHSRTYLWLWVEEATVRTLQFLSRKDGARKQRTFEEGTLSFDDAQAEMCWTDGTRVSMPAAPERALPPFVSALVDQHLS
jgi:hypothetical protein